MSKSVLKALPGKLDIKRHSPSILYLLQERDGYKRIIDSYESEVTLNVGAGSLNRVQHLEENMKAYRKQTELLETELNKVNDELATSRQYCKQVRASTLTELESEIDSVNPLIRAWKITQHAE